jgi:hypothetical protein
MKRVLKGQQFTSTEEVTAKVTKALTQVQKNDFQECFQMFYGCWRKCVIDQWKNSEGNVV